MGTSKTYNEITDLKMGRPHVVILGAGASKAAFPNGDKNGKPIPLMDNLVDVCGLSGLLSKAGLAFRGVNFESIYSDLYNGGNKRLLKEIDLAVFTYFNSLKLPSAPTLYDLLVLSLRGKDLIATFNWDPFLWKAQCRINTRFHGLVQMPYTVFLHGNVAIGYCPNDRSIGGKDSSCSMCRQPFKKCKLLFPIKKNYSGDPYIKDAWKMLSDHLGNAYLLTIFGYSAPDSDVEAIELMKNAWGAPETRNHEQIELIDIKIGTKNEYDLLNKWSPFICEHHYSACDSFGKSALANHPRRSCESMLAQNEEIEYLEPYPFPSENSWPVLRQWLKPRIDIENSDPNNSGLSPGK